VQYCKDIHGAIIRQQFGLIIYFCVSALVIGSGGSGDHRFKPHCSQHVVVSLGKTLHPKLLLWGHKMSG